MLTIVNMNDLPARILRHAVDIRARVLAQGRRAQHHESDHQREFEQVISALIPTECRSAVEQWGAHKLILHASVPVG